MLLLVTLGACGGQFIYNRLGWFTKYQIEKYVDLEGQQGSFVKASMDSVLDWHSENELNKYIAFLDKVKLAVDSDVEVEDVEQWFKEIQLAYDKLLFMMTPWLVELAASLSLEQIEELTLSMSEENEELEDEYLSRDALDYSKSINERLRKNLRYWLGSLTKGQQKKVEQTASTLERLDESWMESRKNWQRRLISILGKQQGWRNELTTLLKDGVEYPKQASQEASERNIERISILIVDILNTRTERQNKKLHKKLNKWRADIAAIRNSHGQIKRTAVSP